MTITTTDVVRLHRQWHETLVRVENGSIPLNVAKRSLQDLIEGRFEKPFNVPDWYVSPEQQLANARNWNQMRNWGFADSDFPGVPDGLVPRSQFEVPVLSVYLPDSGKGRSKVPGYVRTASELWEIARRLQPDWWKWDPFTLDAEHLRLLDGTEAAHTPGIRWTMIDLGANWDTNNGVRPCDVRGKDSAHAEIFAAAAHFPGWIQSMDGINVPYVWLPGYQVDIPGREAWRRVPTLGFSSGLGSVNLGARMDNERYLTNAVPVRRKL